MLRLEDLQIIEEFGNNVAPFQCRVMHKPSGVQVVGNTGSEEHKENLKARLIEALEKAIPTVANVAAPQADTGMQAQLEAMRAEIAALRAGKEVQKKRGRPAKEESHWSTLDPGKVALVTPVAPPTRSFKAPAKVVTKGELA